MNKMNPTEKFKAKAKELGFDMVGVAKARRLDEEAARLETWLNAQYHGSMEYMSNHFEIRVDPRRLVPNAKSVIVLAHNYYPSTQQYDKNAPKIARYAYGNDYHAVLKSKLYHLRRYLRTCVGNVRGRCFVDSAPILERDWARIAGLGWTGKNTLLLNKGMGSYYFLAVMVVDVALEYDAPLGKDYCGTCRRCIEACPTQAIAPQGYVLDARKCISYLTIELREAIPTEFKGKMAGWAFGCDICQEVCPWNRFSKAHTDPQLTPYDELLSMSTEAWTEMTEAVFNDVFAKSALQRTGYAGMVRNLHFWKEEPQLVLDPSDPREGE